jgi:hypothetical protein
MVARTRPDGELVVIFSRDGEPPDSRYVSDGKQAWASAIALISAREQLQHGDVLTVVNQREE